MNSHSLNYLPIIIQTQNRIQVRKSNVKINPLLTITHKNGKIVMNGSFFIVNLKKRL